MKLPVLLGLRYTRASNTARKGGMLSFLSAISMAGLVLGVSLLVIVLSVMNGFERELRERILGLMPQASIFHARGIEDWRSLATQVASFPGVEAAAPFVQIHALLSRGQDAVPAVIYGVDVDYERRISRIAEFVDAEAMQRFAGNNGGILLGVDIAKKLRLELGDDVMVIVPGEQRGQTALIHYLKMLGTINSGSELDQTLVLASISGLAPLRNAREKNRVDGLRVSFTELDRAPELARAIVQELGPVYYQSNWTRTHGNLYHAIQMSKSLVGLLMSLIVALAAFNVVSTLMLVVVEKRASIAILRTLGASSSQIMLTFVVQGLLIGIGGIVLGMLSGCALVLVLEPALQLLEQLSGWKFLHSDVYPLTEIPADIQLSDLGHIALISLVLVLFATLYPAWRATRLLPAEVLRYE